MRRLRIEDPEIVAELCAGKAGRRTVISEGNAPRVGGGKPGR
jgi:hypothetical protein